MLSFCNKSICTIIILFSFFFISYGQNPTLNLKSGNFYPGYIVKNDHDTIWGKSKYISMIDNHFKVIFKESYDEEEEIFRPSELLFYKIMDLNYKSVPFSGRNSFKGQTFMLVIIDGPVTMFKWIYHEKQQYFEDNDFWGYTMDYDPSDPGNQVQYFLQKENDGPVDISSGKFTWRFNKAMAKYLSDYPELSQKIRKKKEGYTIKDVEKIIGEYNSWTINN